MAAVSYAVHVVFLDGESGMHFTATNMAAWSIADELKNIVRDHLWTHLRVWEERANMAVFQDGLQVHWNAALTPGLVCVVEVGEA